MLLNAAAKDSEKGAGWERFEFNKDAPLDDEEIEGQSCLAIFLSPNYECSLVKESSSRN